MFDIGWSELVVIGIVALIVIGPKELPGLLRTLGQGLAKLRAMASDFQHQFNDAMREAEIDDLRKEAEKLTNMASVATDPIAKIGDDLQKAIDKPIDTPAADAANPMAAATPRRARAAARRGGGNAKARRRRWRMSEEDIDATKAPLMEHLIELRSRLIKSLIAFFVTFFLAFMLAKQIYNILLWPYEFAAGPNAQINLIYTAPQEFLFTQIKLGLFGAAFLSFPVVATQIYMFVAPGLYKQERQAFLPYLVATPFCFLLGAAFVYFIAMPLSMRFFLGMQQAGGDGPGVDHAAPARVGVSVADHDADLRLRHRFQLPVVLTLLGPRRRRHRRLAAREAALRHRRVFVVAAVLTPPDVISQFALAFPTLLLYEISIYLVRMVEKKKAAAEAARRVAREIRRRSSACRARRDR